MTGAVRQQRVKVPVLPCCVSVDQHGIPHVQPKCLLRNNCFLNKPYHMRVLLIVLHKCTEGLELKQKNKIRSCSEMCYV